MNGKHRVVFIRISYLLLDVLSVTLAIVLACWLRSHTLPFPINFPEFLVNYRSPYHFVFLFLVFSILFFNKSYNLYQTRRELQESLEVWNVIKSVVSACILTIVVIYSSKVQGFPRSILILSGLFSAMFLSIWRILKRIFVEFLVVHGYNNFNVLIIGAGKVGMALADEIRKRPGFGFRIVGYLDDFKTQDIPCAGYKVIGKLTDFKKIVKKEFINKIFITIHPESKIFIQLLEDAREMGIAVRVIPQGFEFTTGEFGKFNIGFIPVLEYCDEEFMVNKVSKRFFDFSMACLTLLVLAPAFFVIAVLIKLDSPGPAFYSSLRYGRRGKIFPMFKFRSMCNNAHSALDELKAKNEADGPIFKIKNDPRVTRIGRWLRKYSLDELPQLLNVLRGEMSLVGPRPLPIEQIEKEDLRQLKRLEVRPGITGLWQIRGRSDISFVRLVKWDVWYINNWSFWLDLNILAQTIPIVFKGRGAY